MAEEKQGRLANVAYVERLLLIMLAATCLALLGFVGDTWRNIKAPLLGLCMVWIGWSLFGVIVITAVSLFFNLLSLEPLTGRIANVEFVVRLLVCLVVLSIYFHKGGELLLAIVEDHAAWELEQASRSGKPD